MTQYRKKPVVVEASQWFKNGDHPEDTNMVANAGAGEPYIQAEGKVVRYFRRPDVSGHRVCEHPGCLRLMHDHGWIDTLEGGHIVCPGDWVITGVKGERYPCKPDIFAATYELAAAPAAAPAPPVVPCLTCSGRGWIMRSSYQDLGNGLGSGGAWNEPCPTCSKPVAAAPAPAQADPKTFLCSCGQRTILAPAQAEGWQPKEQALRVVRNALEAILKEAEAEDLDHERLMDLAGVARGMLDVAEGRIVPLPPSASDAEPE